MAACDVRFGTFNMHGFDASGNYVKKLLTDLDILFIQEHWLPSVALNKFELFSNEFNFAGKSAMDSKFHSGVLVGRPYGGVGVFWRKSLGSNFKYIGADSDGRVIAISFRADGNLIVCFGVYFPCDDYSRNYLANLDAVLGFITSVCDKYVGCKLMIMGDLNFQCEARCKGFNTFQLFAEMYDIVCCDELDSMHTGYTYFHESLNQRSLIDHVFVSKSIKVNMVHLSILDEGDNTSDHLPITCVVRCCLSSVMGFENVSVRSSVYRWDKGDLVSYNILTGELLGKISHSCDCVRNGVNCSITDHHLEIDIYISEIIHCLNVAAERFVPKCKSSFFKHFWSDSLNELKNDSINAHEMWKLSGKPSSGPVFDIKKLAKWKYKLAIREATRNADAEFSNNLLDSLSNKDYQQF